MSKLLKSLQEMGEKTELKYLVHEGRTYLQEMGEKTKRKTQPLQVYIVRRAWEKSHDLRSHDELKIDDNIIEVSNQIRKF